MADEKKLTPEEIEGKMDSLTTDPSVIKEFADINLSEFTEDELKKLETILEGDKYSSPVYNSVKESIAKKLADRREAIAKDEPSPAATDEKIDDKEEKTIEPEEIELTQKEALAKMAAYDLHIEYNETKQLHAAADEEQKKILEEHLKDIAGIAREETDKFENVTAENAPLFYDYFAITTDRDPSYAHPKGYTLKDIEVMLAEYDEANGLPKDEELNGWVPSATEQVMQNQNAWEAVEKEFFDRRTPKNDFADPFEKLSGKIVNEEGQDVMAILEEEYPEDMKLLKEAIKVSALTRLSFTKPGENSEEVFGKEFSDQQNTYIISLQAIFSPKETLEAKRQSILNQDEIMAEFFEKEGMTKEEWLKKLEALERKTGKKGKDDAAEMRGRMTRFADLQLVRAVTANFATRNEVLNNRVAQKAKLPHVSPRAHQLFQQATQSKIGVMAGTLALNFIVNKAAIAAMGPAGMVAVAAVKTGMAIHKSYKKYKENVPEGEKPSLKGFREYLKNNPNERRNLITQGAIAASSALFIGGAAVAGALSYGALGNALGASAVATSGAAMAWRSIATATISGVSSVFAFSHANKNLVPLHKDLLTIFQKYAKDGRSITPTAKIGGLFNKNTETTLLKELTKNFKNGSEQEFNANVRSYAPDITAADMEKVVELMSKIKAEKSARTGATIGTLAAGVTATLGSSGFSHAETPTGTPINEVIKAEFPTHQVINADIPVNEAINTDIPTNEDLTGGMQIEADTITADSIRDYTPNNPDTIRVDTIGIGANHPDYINPGDANTLETSVGNSSETPFYAADEYNPTTNLQNINDANSNTGYAQDFSDHTGEGPILRNVGGDGLADNPNEGLIDNSVNDVVTDNGADINSDEGNTATDASNAGAEVAAGATVTTEAENLFKFEDPNEFQKVTDCCPTPIIEALKENGLWKEGHDSWSASEWSSESVREHLLSLQEKAANGELTQEQMDSLKAVNDYMHSPEVYQDAHDVDAALEHIREARAAREAAGHPQDLAKEIDQGGQDADVAQQIQDAKDRVTMRIHSNKLNMSIDKEANSASVPNVRDATRPLADLTKGADKFNIEGTDSNNGTTFEAKEVINAAGTREKTIVDIYDSEGNQLSHEKQVSTPDREKYVYDEYEDGKQVTHYKTVSTDDREKWSAKYYNEQGKVSHEKWTSETVDDQYGFGHGKLTADPSYYGSEDGVKNDVIQKSFSANGSTFELGKDGDTGQQYIRTIDSEGKVSVAEATKEKISAFNKAYSKLQDAKGRSGR